MKISQEKREKISEQVLSYLFFNSPKLFFTYDLAKEVARDEEFIKDLLLDLKNKGLVIQVTKNQEGMSYKRRIRWKLTDQAYDAYKKHL
ncbi:MAG: hypothetical protein WAU65_01285 [Candidatus Nanoarchaeia archaeon]